MRELLGFNRLGERDDFMVLYPDAAGPFWNDGRIDQNSPSFRNGVDDVDFIERLVNHVVEEYGGDPERVYVAGFSNGGMMALRAGLDLPEMFAAVASVSGTLPKPMARREGRPPVPMILVHGTEDRTVPWKGGRVLRKKRDHGEVLSVLDTFLFWAWNNGCVGKAVVAPLPGFQGGNATRTYRLSFECGDPSRETVLVAIQGGGHGWPGASLPLRDVRPQTNKGGGEDAVELICTFFLRHRKK
jgi:polyhydroxybutyrate depolymerase